MSRKQKKTGDYGVPGPKYNITGDFNFPDPMNPEDKEGKRKPKFAFGINTKVRAKNLDMPGPGEYEVDVYPSNQKNISYWIGTDDRKDLAPKNSEKYPGPGFYEATDIYAKPPAVS